MNSMKSLLGMVLTEAIEGKEEPECLLTDSGQGCKRKYDLPPIKYDLELIKKPDGSLEWVE